MTAFVTVGRRLINKENICSISEVQQNGSEFFCIVSMLNGQNFSITGTYDEVQKQVKELVS